MPKPKPNAFTFYMKEKRKEVEQRLNRKVDMKELADILGEEFKNLSDDEKDRYKKMKNDPECKSKQNELKMDCRGVPLSTIQIAQQEANRKNIDMDNAIITTVHNLTAANALLQGSFYVLSTSLFVMTEENEYVPAEIAILEFSFQQGIIREYNAILEPRVHKLPGYRFIAKDHSEKYHNLPHDKSDKEAVSYNTAVRKIKEFVALDGKTDRVTLYTLDAERDQTEGVLAQLGACGERKISTQHGGVGRGIMKK